MIGAIVSHPLFGRGRVLEMRNAAREAVVRFDNGIRTVAQTSMLSMLQEIVPSALRPAVEAAVTPGQLEARRTIEALRYGVVPSKRIRELSVGLDSERESLHRAFDEVERSGGDARVIIGEYGAGKSHFFELAANEALERNFLVASASLDIREVPPNRPQRIYNSLIRSLRYPDSPDTGTLVPLFDRILSEPVLYASLAENLRGTTFSTALYNYSLMRSSPGESLDLLLNWISGEKVYIKSVRDALVTKSKEFPARALSMMTTSADQYCYLLNGWGWLANQVGYTGLAVLLDESEHYSLLNQRGQERADNFFKAMIYTAMRERPGCRLSESDLLHQQRQHPFRFSDRSELLLMFAVTPSASTFDYLRWLDEDQVLSLNGHMPADEIDKLMEQIQMLHRQAYCYDRSISHIVVSQGVRECLDRRLINLRQTIRLATEIYDLCYAYPDYNESQAVEEMQRNLIGF